jgi:predicted dehydrogenase
MAIRVIVAGLGPRGCDWVREVRADSAFELAACVEIDGDVLRHASSSLSLRPEQRFEELGQALEQIPCDALIVATSADQHTGGARLALERGLGVLIEKPFTLNLSEAVGLVELAEEKRAPLVVAQNYRYMRVHRTARKLIREGVLGQIGMVLSQYYRVPHKMAASLARLPESILWGMGVHHLDALRYVLGQEVTAVSAQSFTQPWNELPKGASMQVMLSFAEGTSGFYSATYESSGHEYFEGGQEFYQRYVGERATLHVFHRWLFLCERGRLPRFVRRGARGVTEESHLLRQLERALIYDIVPESSGRDNLHTMSVVEACVRSANEGKWIDPRELFHAAD